MRLWYFDKRGITELGVLKKKVVQIYKVKRKEPRGLSKVTTRIQNWYTFTDDTLYPRNNYKAEENCKTTLQMELNRQVFGFVKKHLE